MSNLNSVLTSLAKGDTVTVDFSSAIAGDWAVTGPVNIVKIGATEFVKVGNVTVGHTDETKVIRAIRPQARVKLVTVVSRAPKPFYKNRPTDRKPLKNDIVGVGAFGDKFYFDGSRFHPIAQSFTASKAFSRSEFDLYFGASGHALISEQAI